MRQNFVSFALLALFLMMQGCTLVKHPTSNNFHQVRYRPHLSLWEKHGSKEKDPLRKMPALTAQVPLAKGRTLSAIGLDKAPNLSFHTPPPAERNTPQSGQTATTREPSVESMPPSEDKAYYPLLPRDNKNHSGSEKPTIDFKEILYYVLAFLLPPLAMALVFGITGEFWLNLLLTLLGWLPGVIHALWSIIKFYHPI